MPLAPVDVFHGLEEIEDVTRDMVRMRVVLGDMVWKVARDYAGTFVDLIRFLDSDEAGGVPGIGRIRLVGPVPLSQARTAVDQLWRDDYTRHIGKFGIAHAWQENLYSRIFK